MKKILLLLTILIYSTASYSQYYMTGRFSNTTPDVGAGIDSGIFIFTQNTYEYYINTNTAPSSTGTYWVASGGNTDTLYMIEDSLGVCSQGQQSVTVWFNVDYTVSPYYSLIVSESANSMANCPTHSAKIQGTYIAWDGTIIPLPTSVGNTPSGTSALNTHVYNNQLTISSTYNELVSVTVTNINGQKVLKTQQATLLNGSKAQFDLNGLAPGMYFAIIQSEHEQKAVKIAL